MRKAFDDCTVMAGVENDFECVYITKDAAVAFLGEIEAENEKLREFAGWLMTYISPEGLQVVCNRACPAYDGCCGAMECHFRDWAERRANELGIEVE